MRCQQCGRENAAHYKFCLGCGTELVGLKQDVRDDRDRTRQVARCRDCGAEYPADYRFCPKCGTRAAEPQREFQDDSDRARKIEAMLEEVKTFEKFGLHVKAIERMEQVVALAPDNPEYLLELDGLRLRAGKIQP